MARGDAPGDEKATSHDVRYMRPSRLELNPVYSLRGNMLHDLARATGLVSGLPRAIILPIVLTARFIRRRLPPRAGGSLGDRVSAA
jgi:hypothetical protein